MLSEREKQRLAWNWEEFNIPEPHKCQMMQSTNSFKHLLSKQKKILCISVGSAVALGDYTFSLMSS